uniref:Transposase IS204/IS1001/IS1096/IS1165 family protein n=1 Tax=Cyanothece sp. (strain PCC 7425 / ATCC 29141) TaxID=395961 RepID=B8HZA2_CYAP4
MELLQSLLPDPIHLRLESWTLDRAQKQLTLTIRATQSTTPCPLCQGLTQRIHSRYQRTLRDLPCAHYAVKLRLQVRKFFCTNPLCQRRIFTERLPQVTLPWARRTVRLAEQFVAIGLALGGAAGVRLSRTLGHPMSLNCLLHLVSQRPLPALAVPKTLGVDDFAFRKGQTYGTVLVDLDQHRPIALLPDREANTLAEWLKQHPGVEVLSRDRSRSYKQGMSEGAAEAVQVADRFHLLQNLAEVLESFFATQSKALKTVDLAHHRTPEPELEKPTQALIQRQQRAQQRRERRLANYEQVHQLRQQGFSVPDIAHHLAMGERTVFRYLASPEFPEWQPHPRHTRKSSLDPYKTYLIEQWNGGQRQTKLLFVQIQQQGYRGSYATVARYTHYLRQVQRQSLNVQYGRGQVPPHLSHPRPPLSARRATWLVLKPAKQRSEDQQALLARLHEHPDLTGAIDLVQGFAQLVRQRQSEQLDPWLEQATSSSLSLFQRFAKSLQEDYAAVKAGVTLHISNGQVEGQINRLKMLKRQMYGRAGLPLLSRRFLLAC